jgi:predicted nuclease of predicted toxin-antitoxin system
MLFFADENIGRAMVRWIRADGKDVLYAAEAHPGESDVRWLSRAEVESRIILTSDKDFGDLIFRDALNSHGVVLLRLSELSVADALARLQQVWSVIEANPSGKFIVVTARKTRVRPLPRR